MRTFPSDCKFRRGLTHQKCIDEFNKIFGDENPSETSVHLWYGKFNRSRRSLEEGFRESRQKSVVFRKILILNASSHMAYREMFKNYDCVASKRM